MIGIEFDKDCALTQFNGHDGKKYFECRHPGRGYFVFRSNILTLSQKEMLKNLPEYIKGCYSEKVEEQIQNTQHIRKILSIERNPPIDGVIKLDCSTFHPIPTIQKNTKLQFEAGLFHSHSFFHLTKVFSGLFLCLNSVGIDQYRIGTCSTYSGCDRNGAIPLFVNY